MTEEWRAVVGYEGLYEVSDLSRIRGITRGKIKKFHVHKRGYAQTNLCKNGIVKTIRIHRIVAEAFIEKVEGKNHINHIDNVRSNNKVSNLEWCTSKENAEHRDRQKRGTIGERNGNTNLTNKLVDDIRKSYPKISGYRLAKNYNVSHTTIYNILNNKSWNN
jgi:hypothetical protein